MNPYLAGACVLGATEQPAALVDERPMSVATATGHLAQCASKLEVCGESDLLEQCTNIAASIQARAIDPLPDAAADVLAAFVRRVQERCGDGVVGMQIIVKGSVLGARTKQTSVMGDDEELSSDEYDVLGMYDITSAQHQMDALKMVSVRAAQALLKGGQSAINKAIELANERGLPGPTERKNVQAHLQWHADHLMPLARTPNAMYESANDLKKYVMMAFVDENAVEEGAAYLDQIWDQMWQEVAAAIAALPAEIRHAAAAAVENITGLPWWAWAAITVGAVGLVGYSTVKILSGPAGGAVVKHYLR